MVSTDRQVFLDWDPTCALAKKREGDPRFALPSFCLAISRPKVLPTDSRAPLKEQHVVAPEAELYWNGPMKIAARQSPVPPRPARAASLSRSRGDLFATSAIRTNVSPPQQQMGTFRVLLGNSDPTLCVHSQCPSMASARRLLLTGDPFSWWELFLRLLPSCASQEQPCKS